MVVQLIRNQQVSGSNPLGGSNIYPCKSSNYRVFYLGNIWLVLTGFNCISTTLCPVCVSWKLLSNIYFKLYICFYQKQLSSLSPYIFSLSQTSLTFKFKLFKLHIEAFEYYKLADQFHMKFMSYRNKSDLKMAETLFKNWLWSIPDVSRTLS